jgi:hypothetical protein
MAYSWEQHLGNAAKSCVELATSPLKPLFDALTPSIDSREPSQKSANNEMPVADEQVVTKSEIPKHIREMAMAAVTPQFASIQSYSPANLGGFVPTPQNLDGLQFVRARQAEQPQMAMA